MIGLDARLDNGVATKEMHNRTDKHRHSLPHLLAVVWLSVITVWLGVGIGLVHCRHSGATEIMQMSQMAMPGGDCCKTAAMDDCCEHLATAPCMDVKILKLPVSIYASSLSFDFTQIPVTACLLPTVIELKTDVFSVCRNADLVARVWHGPPRVWLSIIRVLQI